MHEAWDFKNEILHGTHNQVSHEIHKLRVKLDFEEKIRKM